MKCPDCKGKLNEGCAEVDGILRQGFTCPNLKCSVSHVMVHRLPTLAALDVRYAAKLNDKGGLCHPKQLTTNNVQSTQLPLT